MTAVLNAISSIFQTIWNNIPNQLNYYVQYVNFPTCGMYGLMGVVLAGDRGMTYNYCMNKLTYDYPVTFDYSILSNS